MGAINRKEINKKNNMIGVAINREGDSINTYIFYTENDYHRRGVLDNLKAAKNFIKEKRNMIPDKEDNLITEYTIFPKCLIDKVDMNKIKDNYEVIVTIKNNNKFLIGIFNNINEAEKLIDIVLRIIKNNIIKDLSDQDKITYQSISPMNTCTSDGEILQSIVKEEIIDKNNISNDIQNIVSSLSTITIKEDNKSSDDKEKKKNKSIEYDDLPLEEIDASKIMNFSKFSGAINEVIKKIKIDEDCGTTLADISKSIIIKMGYPEGKRFNEQEKTYLLNELRKKFPGRLLRRMNNYNLYDFQTRKNSGATTVFRGLIFEDRPRRLPKILRK